MKQRLKQIIEFYELTPYSLEQKIFVSEGTISKFLVGKIGMKVSTLTKILEFFPDISPDWFLLNHGEMFRKSSSNVAVASAPHAAASNGNLTIAAPAELVSLITSQQETINRLSETVDRLLRVRDSSNVTEG